MVPAPEDIIGNSPMVVDTSGITKKPISINSLHQFSDLFGVNKKTAFRRLDDANRKIQTVSKGNYLWSNISKSERLHQSQHKCDFPPNNCILQYPQVMNPPIEYDCIKICMDYPNEKICYFRCLSENYTTK